MVSKLGTAALNGTKIHADASRHGALSYERAGQIEMQWREEVGKLTAMAEAADQADVPDAMSLPRGTRAARKAPGRDRPGARHH
jgi:hypothetical protein